MRAWAVEVDFPEVLRSAGTMDARQISFALFIPLIFTCLIYVQLFILKTRAKQIFVGISCLLLCMAGAIFLNSNSDQEIFSFLSDGLMTTYAVATNSLSEKEWSADTWVLQACMLWWMILFASLLITIPWSEPRSSVRTG